MTDSWAKPLSRRAFIRYGALAGMTALGGWRLLAPARGPDWPPFTTLGRSQARILAAVYGAVTLERDPAALLEAMRFFDAFIGKLDSRTRVELGAALQLVEQSPLFFHGFLGRFSALAPERRALCLEGWRTGADWRRPVFGALKDLCYLYLYTREEAWTKIGYPGPWVRKGSANPQLERRYAGLTEK